MWLHPTTKDNLQKIQENKNWVIPVATGELASGLFGEGRMAEPEEIMHWLEEYFSVNQSFSGKKVLITAGPTYEAIDPVRFIGNHSSGKMGIAIANEFYKRGASVTLVCGPTAEMIPSAYKTVRITSAAQMYEACISEFPQNDIAIMSAAVADYTIAHPMDFKIKKNEESLTLELIKTKDVLKALGELKKENQFLVGFALETNNEKENALLKLRSKKLDMIVLNSLKDEGAGFGFNTNKIAIFDKEGNGYDFEKKSKNEVAKDIVHTIFKLLHA